MKPPQILEPNAPVALRSNDELPPLRLFEGGGTAFERSLVEPARGDQIPEASLERLARLLHVPASGLPARPLGSPAGKSLLPRWASLAGLCTAGLIAALAVQGSRDGEGPRDTEPFGRSRLGHLPAPPTRPGRGPTNTPAQVETHGAAPVEPEAAPAGTKSRTAEMGRARAPRGATAPAAPDRHEPESAQRGPSNHLRQELRALERVQTALRAGKVEEATRSLSEYAARFPQGELHVEGRLLGVDVALARGDDQQARELARELLARPDAARYGARLEARLGQPRKSSEGGPALTRRGANRPSTDIDEPEVNR